VCMRARPRGSLGRGDRGMDRNGAEVAVVTVEEETRHKP